MQKDERVVELNLKVFAYLKKEGKMISWQNLGFHTANFGPI